MKVRSLNSSVLKRPDAKEVDLAVRSWAQKAKRVRPEVLRIGYFGCYGRKNWGVGSDLDLLVLAHDFKSTFLYRSSEWDTTDLPVPPDVLGYTEDEWNSLRQNSGFFQILEEEIIWGYPTEELLESGVIGKALQAQISVPMREAESEKPAAQSPCP